MAKRRMKANFEFINKLGVDWWCFHDRDIAPDGKTLEESNANLDEVVALAKELQEIFYELSLDFYFWCFGRNEFWRKWHFLPPSCKTAAEYDCQRENFFNELEIVYVDVLHLDANSGVTLKIEGM